MAVLAMLRVFVRELDEVDDFRKGAPNVVELKRQALRVIAELEAAQAARLGAGRPGQGKGPA